MDQPNYIYIRGQGWQVEPPVKQYVREDNGFKMVFEDRLPRIGELYFDATFMGVEKLSQAIRTDIVDMRRNIRDFASVCHVPETLGRTLAVVVYHGPA